MSLKFDKDTIKKEFYDLKSENPDMSDEDISIMQIDHCHLL